MSSPPDDVIEFESEESSPDVVVVNPQFDLAIEQNSATIDYLTNCIRLMDEAENEAHLRASIKYYPKLVIAFESKWGKIRRFYHNKHSGLITTEQGFLLHTETDADLDTLDLLHKCDKLSIEAKRLLRGGDRLCCLDMQYELLSHLLGSMYRLKEGEKTKEEHSELVQYLANDFEEIKKKFQESAQRNAVLEYYTGMLNGLGIIVALIVVLTIYSVIDPALKQMLTLTSASFISGGIGAIISVMQRISTGNFKPNKEADPSHNNRIGIFRPILGAVMGVIVYFLMRSGLIPFSLPSEIEIQFYYISSIAFSAGFTERWAQDMLPSTKEPLTTKDNQP